MVFNLIVQDDPVGFVRGQPGQAERVGGGPHQVDGGHGRGRWVGDKTEIFSFSVRLERAKREGARWPSPILPFIELRRVEVILWAVAAPAP